MFVIFILILNLLLCVFHGNITSAHDIISSTVTAKKIAFNIAKKYSYN